MKKNGSKHANASVEKNTVMKMLNMPFCADCVHHFRRRLHADVFFAASGEEDREAEKKAAHDPAILAFRSTARFTTEITEITENGDSLCAL